MTSQKSKAILWTIIGLGLLGWGIGSLWSGNGGVTAWILVIAGALNTGVFGLQLIKGGEE